MEGKKPIQISLGMAICIFIIFILIVALVITYYFGFVKNNNDNETKVNSTNIVQNETNIQEEIQLLEITLQILI